MKLSLCMIVKNEEEILARCLESPKDLFDEIIIVDTGSTDKTKEVALKFTKKIYDFKWVDDFSVARNYSFSKATSEYIMWLDADDVIESEDLIKLKQLKHNLKDVDVVMLKYNISFDEQNKPTFSYYRERIIKNDKTFFWQDPIHEAIVPHGKIIYNDAGISHRKIKPVEMGRNLKIYQQLIKKNIKFSARQKFYYSRELFYNGKYKEAIKSFNEYLDKYNGWVENQIEACYNLTSCYKFVNNIDKALSSAFISFNFDLPRAELLCEIGNIFVLKGKYNIAIYWYKLASKCKVDYEKGGFILKDCYNIVPYLQLCLCYYNLGDTKKAIYYNNKASKLRPNHPSVLFNKAFFKKLNQKKS